MTPHEEERRLLIVEDDAAFARTLLRSFERRGYLARTAASQDDMLALLPGFAPTHAVVDLKLAGDASGLACVKALRELDPDMLIVVLTGYASIATAVEAIKLGAHHYLARQRRQVQHPSNRGLRHRYPRFAGAGLRRWPGRRKPSHCQRWR